MASFDNARDQTDTHLQKKMASDGRLINMAKNLKATDDLASALDYLIGDGRHARYAIALLAAFHAPSAGSDGLSSPAYAPPDGLSPVVAWRGGPSGGATMLELAGKVVSNPLDFHAQRAFMAGLRNQSCVIKELYDTSGNAGFTGLKRFVVNDTKSVRERLLAVYDVMHQAVAIVDDIGASRASGFRQLNLSDQMDGHQAVGGEAPFSNIGKEEMVDFLNGTLTNKLDELFTPLAVGLDKDKKEFMSELRSLASKSKELEAKLEGTTGRASNPNGHEAQDAQDKAMLTKIANLEAELEATHASKDRYAAALAADVERLQGENDKLVNTLRANASVPSSVVASRSLASYTPGRKAGVSNLELPKDMPQLPDWTDVPAPAGLESAKPPDYAEAWASRPQDGEMGKAARKQLTLTLVPEKLLDPVPPAGDATAYSVVRSSLLESFFMFATYLHGGGIRGEMALFRAVRACATAKFKSNDKTESYWRSLMSTTSVRDFIHELDSVFADRNHTASEAEWENAKKNATDALDYFTRLRHLISESDASIVRGRSELSKYLAARGETHALSDLQKCGLKDLDGWYTVLDSLRSVKKQVASAAPPTRKVAALEQQLAALVKTKNSARTDCGIL